MFMRSTERKSQMLPLKAFKIKKWVCVFFGLFCSQKEIIGESWLGESQNEHERNILPKYFFCTIKEKSTHKQWSKCHLHPNTNICTISFFMSNKKKRSSSHRLFDFNKYLKKIVQNTLYSTHSTCCTIIFYIK